MMFIEINLSPQAAATSSGKGLSASGRGFRIATGKHPVIVSAAIVVIAATWVAIAAWNLDARGRTVAAMIDSEVADSVALSAVLTDLRSLEAREDTIARRVEFIHGVDGRRFIWPRLMSEISGAMPANAWILEIIAGEGPDTTAVGPGFHIQGRAGSTDALTRLMRNLERSGHIKGVTLVATEQERLDDSIVQRFVLEAEYESADVSRLYRARAPKAE